MHRGEEGVCVIHERDIASTDIKLGKQLVVVGNPGPSLPALYIVSVCP